jgi:hypothetical protein
MPWEQLKSKKKEIDLFYENYVCVNI